MQAGAGSNGAQARTPRKTGISGGSVRQPSVYAGFRMAYPQAHYLRGFPACLPANAQLARDSEAAQLERPKDAEYRSVDHSAPLRPAGSRPTHPSGDGLPGTPRKTGISGRAARQPSVYAGFRVACPQAQYLRALPACLPANAQLARELARNLAPPCLKRPKDAGFRAAAADSTRRTARRRNAVTIFRYLTLCVPCQAAAWRAAGQHNVRGKVKPLPMLAGLAAHRSSIGLNDAILRLRVYHSPVGNSVPRRGAVKHAARGCRDVFAGRAACGTDTYF